MQITGRGRESGVCLPFYTHAEAEGGQVAACAVAHNVSKPVIFAYWPSRRPRVMAPPHPVLTRGDGRARRR